MLRFIDLALRRGPRLILEEANFVIHAGQKVGITGANGAGKSSLLALVRGEMAADRGSFERPEKLEIAHVAQELPAVDDAAIDYVMAGDDELARLQTAIMEAQGRDDGKRLASLYERLENIDGYTARSRAAVLLHGLGFQDAEFEQAVKAFSGGWRMRLNLARALMCRSDLLLLDEPTNHLDLDAVFWLQDWLKAYAGTLLLISHDRDFLDDVANHVLHLEQGRVTLYSGNYTDFERQRAEKLAQQQAQYEKQQRERAHIQKFIDRFRAQATKARQAQSRIKALERMSSIAPAHVDSPFGFSFPPPQKLPRPLLKFDQVDAGYDAKVVLKGISLVLEPGDRIGLVGSNGAGKSTLIKTLAAQLQPATGKVERHPDLAVGYFAQHQLEHLRPDHSVLSHLQKLDSKASEQSLRDFAGGFGFRGDDVTAAIDRFSGGEKARLALALLVYQGPNLLMLDEPTNHLDLEMRHALALALQDFAGALLVVSHDRHLLRTTTDTLWKVADGRVEPFDGDLEDYHRWLMEQEREKNRRTSQSTTPSVSRKDQRRLEAARRARLQPYRDAVKKVEDALAKASASKARVEAALADAALYGDENKKRLQETLAEQGAVKQKLDQLEAQWLEATEAMEQAEREID